MSDDRKANKAGADLKKLRQAEEGKKALLDYESEAVATRAKTERLRRLRLLRLEAEANAPKVVPKKKAAKAAKTKAPKAQPKALSDWLSDQKKDGLN